MAKFNAGAFLLWAATCAHGSNDTAALCEDAARIAADETGVPLNVLMAIALSETGRTISGRFQPWPWTVNSEGVGKWFESPQEALRFATTEQQSGKKSFDVGCFQLNYRWHGQAFQSVDHMFDPRSNARYAARFLTELYAETGNWQDAAAFYHSRTPEYANKYRARFSRILARLGQQSQSPVDDGGARRTKTDPVAPRRANAFPLLLAENSGAASLGSLFPSRAPSTQPFFGD